MTYLKKLTAEHQDIGGSLFYLYFPEIVNGAKSINWAEYKEVWLIEAEKFLRKLRVISMRIDRAMDTTIKKIRDIYVDNEDAGVVVETNASTSEGRKEKIEDQRLEPIDVMDLMRKEEQDFIVEIAKNPKEASNYKLLAGLYERMGNMEDAVESYKTAAELDPDDDVTRIKLAKLLERADEIKKKHDESTEDESAEK